MNIGHQMCKAEGGASCSEKDDGLATSISLDYAVLSWLDVGLESGFGQFPGSDGYSTVSTLVVVSASYSWDKWALIATTGAGLLHVWHTRAELGVGDVTYDYTSWQSLRFGGGLTYDLNDDYSVGLMSHYTLGGTGEVCTEIGGREGNCSDQQDLIDLLSTTARVTYRF